MYLNKSVILYLRLKSNPASCFLFLLNLAALPTGLLQALDTLTASDRVKDTHAGCSVISPVCIVFTWVPWKQDLRRGLIHRQGVYL